MLKNWVPAVPWTPVPKHLVIGLVSLVFVVSTGVIYFTGGTEGQFHALAHLYYVPVVLAALSFGPLAGLLTGLCAALVGGPLMPANVALHIMQPAGDWLTRGFFFMLIGGTVGLLTGQLRSALAAERHRRRLQDVLHDIDKGVLRDQSLDRTFSRTVQAVASLLDADLCCVYVRDDDGGLASASSWPRAASECWPADTGIQPPADVATLVWPVASLATSHGGVVIVADVTEDSRLPDSARREAERIGLRSLAVAPLARSDQEIGALLVGYAEPCRFSKDQQVDLAHVAHQAAVVLKNAHQLEQLNRFGHETIAAFSEAIAQRDEYTAKHVSRITQYAIMIARSLGLPPEEIVTIEYAAQLHDVGKLAVPTDILRKSGSLSQPEWSIIEQHPTIGGEMLERVSFLRDAAPVVRHHHEQFNGTGYPAGLRGDDIPLGARIVSVADAFDAMMSDRPYRPALSFGKATQELKDKAGTQFDPEVVDAFLQVLNGAGNDYARNGRGSMNDVSTLLAAWSADDSPVSNVINDDT